MEKTRFEVVLGCASKPRKQTELRRTFTRQPARLLRQAAQAALENGNAARMATRSLLACSSWRWRWRCTQVASYLKKSSKKFSKKFSKESSAIAKVLEVWGIGGTQRFCEASEAKQEASEDPKRNKLRGLKIEQRLVLQAGLGSSQTERRLRPLAQSACLGTPQTAARTRSRTCSIRKELFVSFFFFFFKALILILSFIHSMHIYIHT